MKMGKDVAITNHGATILKQMQVFHPAARMQVELSNTRDEEAGGGTTLMIIIAGSLRFLSEAFSERDSSNHHFHVLPEGFRKGY